MVSFSVPVNKDRAATDYKTVHVVIVKPKLLSDAELVIRPLLIILPLATLLVLILYRIKSSRKNNAAVDSLEIMAARLDDIERGIL